MKMDSRAPSFDVIRGRVIYDPETGVFTMRVSAGRKRAGARAGYPDALGYWKLFINGRWVLAHRLAWALMNGDKWPDGEIDHINGDPSDNRIVNLRVATRSQNVANAKFNSLNTTGFRGVCAVKRPSGTVYQADIRKDGRKVYLGTFKTPQEAHGAYVAAAIKTHGDYFAADAEGVFVEAAKAPPAEQLSLLGEAAE
jgi:hypothetical protein